MVCDLSFILSLGCFGEGSGREKVGRRDAREAIRRFLKYPPLKVALELEIARGVHIWVHSKTNPL